jgi:hypothetical protein
MLPPTSLPTKTPIYESRLNSFVSHAPARARTHDVVETTASFDELGITLISSALTTKRVAIDITPFASGVTKRAHKVSQP